MIFQGMKICLGHDQRHIRVHSVSVGVVDNDGPGFNRLRAVFYADFGAGREKYDIEPLETAVARSSTTMSRPRNAIF